MQTNYDVIIAGAGPAGALSAYYLCEKGLKVLLIEKQKLPRYKICGGGIQKKALKHVPFDFSSVVQNKVNRFTFSYQFKSQYIRESVEPLVYCTMRNEFDYFLVSKAVEKGCVLYDETEIKNVYEHEVCVKVKTEKENFSANYLIGADGAYSTVAKSLGLKAYDFRSFAFEAEVHPEYNVYKNFEKSIYIDWGTLADGYSWIFPKKDHLSIGVESSYYFAKYLKEYFDLYLKKNNLKQSDISSLKAFVIPHRISDTQIATKRIILIGDAAGLVDTFSGEGIYYAVLSAKMSAEVIYNHLTSKINSLSVYQDKINNQILPEIVASTEIRQIFNFIPKISHNLLQKKYKVWHAMNRIITGESNFCRVKNKFGILWNPLLTISEFYLNRKIKSAKKGINPLSNYFL